MVHDSLLSDDGMGGAVRRSTDTNPLDELRIRKEDHSNFRAQRLIRVLGDIVPGNWIPKVAIDAWVPVLPQYPLACTLILPGKSRKAISVYVDVNNGAVMLSQESESVFLEAALGQIVEVYPNDETRVQENKGVLMKRPFNGVDTFYVTTQN